MTGILITTTQYHSSKFNGTVWKIVWKKGTYKIIKWSSMLRQMASTSHTLFHNGNVNNDSFSDNLS